MVITLKFNLAHPCRPGDILSIIPGDLPDPPRIGTEGGELKDSYRRAVSPRERQKSSVIVIDERLNGVALGPRERLLFCMH